MNVIEAIRNRRTIRKFRQEAVSSDDLMKIIDSARYAAYGGNLQPLKFAVLQNGYEVYPLTRWAAYLPDWEPAEDERPTCYIAILGDTSVKSAFEADAGAAITNMMLCAEEMGLATCWLGAIDREALAEMLGTELPVLYLLAVGYPNQQSKVCDMKDGSVKYFEDENGVINVPKRPLKDIIL